MKSTAAQLNQYFRPHLSNYYSLFNSFLAKLIIPGLGLVSGWISPLQGQNLPPQISNLSLSVDDPNGEVLFLYDLLDLEGDSLEVWIQVSDDNGMTWRVPADSMTGDAGFPVFSGTGKALVWHFDLAQLALFTGHGGPFNLVARLIVDDHQIFDIQTIVDQVDSVRLWDNLSFIEGIRHRTANPTHLEAIRDSIYARATSGGMKAWGQSFVYGGYNATNPGGRLAGTRDEAKTWFGSGHFDTVNISPGADDNGSSVAALMELMRVLGSYHYSNSIRLVAFDLEESGLIGSNRWVNLNIPAWEQVAGVLQMEMIGYYDNAPNTQTLPFGFNLLFPAVADSVIADSSRGNFLTNVANVASHDLKVAFDACALAYVPGLRVLSLETTGNGQGTPDLRRSDHASFWDAGYPALMLTDGADFRNAHYHTSHDTLGTINLNFLTNNTKAVAATLAKLAGIQHSDVAISQPFVVDSLAVGLDQANEALEWDLRAFPNPAFQTVSFTFTLKKAGNFKLKITDAAGKVVIEKNLGKLSKGLNQIDQKITELAPGLYFGGLEGSNQRAMVRWLRLD